MWRHILDVWFFKMYAIYARNNIEVLAFGVKHEVVSVVGRPDPLPAFAQTATEVRVPDVVEYAGTGGASPLADCPAKETER